MEERIIITVDGLAGSGKTTLSRLLAERLGSAHLNSGLLYRAVGFLALRYSTDCSNQESLSALLAKHKIELALGNSKKSEVSIDGEVVAGRLYQPDVSEITSIAASQPVVRETLVALQREAFAGENLVAEGRDMGTVVFPQADLKFFITAAVGVRVKRRIEQLYGGLAKVPADKLNVLKKEMEIEVTERDRRDLKRTISPTKPAQDALTIDNSVETLTQVVQNMYDSALKRNLI